MSISRRLNQETKVDWIDPSFPNFAHTSTKTIVEASLVSTTTTLGYKKLAELQGTSWSDPFGDLQVHGTDGVIEASLFEAAGHDIMDLIYGSYRVLSSTLVFTIWHTSNQQLTFTDADISDTTAGRANNSGVSSWGHHTQQKLCIIPSSSQNEVCDTWQEAMHHPLAYIKDIPPPLPEQIGRKVTIKVTIPNHASFIDRTFSHPANEMSQSRVMIDLPNGTFASGQRCYYHVYILGDHQKTGNTYINYTATMYQHVLLSKFTGTNTSIAVSMGNDMIPTLDE